MTPKPDEAISPERQQTDESLRLERERADAALAEDAHLVDDVADAVIAKARVHADEVLSAARIKTDRRSCMAPPTGVTPAALAKERGLEDRALREERAEADEALQRERAEHMALLATERDETDKDLIRERDRSDDALATRDEFLGIVSHDLRTLLNQVMGFAGLITMELSGKGNLEQIAEDAERIRRSGIQMNRLIGDLTDIAGIHAGTLTVTAYESDPGQVATEAIDTFQTQASARGITLGARLVVPMPVVVFDPARILQVLTNLLSNAIKFTPRGGRVVLEVKRRGPDLCFTVADTGIGIPLDKLDAVFERYVQVATNDRRGVGLGLYISKCIVQGHGGRIWVESRPGNGSTFSFTLPMAA